MRLGSKRAFEVDFDSLGYKLGYLQGGRWAVTVPRTRRETFLREVTRNTDMQAGFLDAVFDVQQRSDAVNAHMRAHVEKINAAKLTHPASGKQRGEGTPR